MKPLLSSREIRYMNVRALIERLGGVSAFAKKIDREQPQVSSFAGENPSKGIGGKMARHIEECLSLEKQWLDTPHFEEWPAELMDAAMQQQIDAAHAESEAIMKVSEPSKKPNTIPIVGTAQLGIDGFWDENQYPTGFGDGSIAWVSNDQNAYALKCVGDSMSPRIRHGEYVLVEPNHGVMPGDEVVVKTTDGQSMIKLFLYEREGRVHLDSVNNHFGQTVIDKESIARMHYVAGIAKASLLRY